MILRMLTTVIFLCVFGLTKSDAQISIGHHVQWTKGAPLKADALEKFKATTTVFVVRKEDDLNLFAEELKKVWTITPLEVITLDEIDSFLGKLEYSIFQIQSDYVSTTTKSNRTSACKWVALNLIFNKLDKKGKVYGYPVSKMELHPEIKTLLRGEEDDNSFPDYIYTDATIYNWNLVTVINFVKQVNEHFRKKKGQAFYANFQNDRELKRLKRKTLYVPEYMLREFKPVAQTEDEFLDAEKLFSNYEYKYKVISAEELQEMYLTAEKSFYYLTAVKSCNKVLINVINGKTGETVYADSPGLIKMTYNIKPKNLKELGKKIGKIK